MPTSGLKVGIDFGTSNTVGVLRRPDGRTEVLLFDGSPLLPSGVFLGTDGQFLTGRDAQHSARIRPDAFEPNPKRRIDDGTVFLGDRAVPVPELVAAVLRRVLTETRRVGGREPDRFVLTHPAAWGRHRQEQLTRAAALAGIDAPTLVPEPVAAVSNFLALSRVPLPEGRSVVVYDFGGGTFDATVVQRIAGDLRVTASEGLADVGGLDIDEALFTYLRTSLGDRAAAVWPRLALPANTADLRASRLLRDDVRHAKEMLSRAPSAHVHVPLLDDDVPVGRELLEQLARPLLDRTVAATRSAVRNSGAPADSVAAFFLVGGSSRIPLAATLLHRQFGVAPAVVENPESVVAQGAVLADDVLAAPAVVAAATVSAGRAHVPTMPFPTTGSASVSYPPSPVRSGAVPPPEPRRRGGRKAALGAAAAVVVLILTVVLALRFTGDDGGTPTADANTSASPSAPATPSTSPSPSPTPTESAQPTTAGPRAEGALIDATGFCVEAPATLADGDRVVVNRCTGSPLQRWTFTAGGALAGSGKCLDLNNGESLGYRVQLWECNNTNPQIFEQRADGSIRNVASSLCLGTGPAGRSEAPPELLQGDCGDAAPVWRFA